MFASVLLDECRKAGIDFFTGVPDSFLKGLCDELYDRFGTDGPCHIVAHNEGGALGLCAAEVHRHHGQVEDLVAGFLLQHHRADLGPVAVPDRQEIAAFDKMI